MADLASSPMEIARRPAFYRGEFDAAKTIDIASRGAPARGPGQCGRYEPGGPVRDQLLALVRSCLRRLLLSADGELGVVPDLIGNRETLLVLDDFPLTTEHVTGLVELMHRCPSLRTVVTTRILRGGTAGRLFPLSPLPIPPTDGGPAWEPTESERLLLHRIRRLRPGYVPDTEDMSALRGICRLLDGIPSFVERAGDWSLVYTPTELVGAGVPRSLALLSIPGSAPSAPSAGAAIAAVVAGLDVPVGEALAKLTLVDGCWTVGEAAYALGQNVAVTASHVHTLLLHGLLRPIENRAAGVATRRFQILHLVRRIVGN